MQKDASGQRELDSDEMDEEMMDEHQNVVQPGWKVTDAAATPKNDENDMSPDKKDKRSQWG